MSITKKEAEHLVQEFLLEYKGCSHLKFVLLDTKEDFYEHYGRNADAAYAAWQGKSGAFFRTRNAVHLSVAGAYDGTDFKRVLRHEGLGHSGINTFNAGEKQALLEAIIEARYYSPRINELWQSIEGSESYSSNSKLENAEGIFCFAIEKAAGDLHPDAAEYAWQKSVIERSEPLKEWGLRQIAENVAQGLRDNTRTQKIFPLTDSDQFGQYPPMKQRLLVMNGQKLIQNEQDGKWVTDKVEKAETIKAGIYNIYLSSPADKTKTHTGVIVYKDQHSVYQQVGKSFVKHECEAFDTVPKAGSAQTIAYDEQGKASVAMTKLERSRSR